MVIREEINPDSPIEGGCVDPIMAFCEDHILCVGATENQSLGLDHGGLRFDVPNAQPLHYPDDNRQVYPGGFLGTIKQCLCL